MVSMDAVSNENAGRVENRKPKRQRLKVGDPDFVPPDGGWGWLIVFACGIGNLCSFPMFHQFGLVFKEKFKLVGISQSETITILNYTVAFNTGIGLINGPLFKVFTQRQVAMVGSCLVVISLLVSAYCTQFWSHLLFFSILYGASFGILEAANSLAINTYFEVKRRVATGYSWTVTALGPIVCPYVIVFLDKIYGIEGVIVLFAGVALHSFVCALFLQPVEWHTKFRETDETKSAKAEKIHLEETDEYAYVNKAYLKTEHTKEDSYKSKRDPLNCTKEDVNLDKRESLNCQDGEELQNVHDAAASEVKTSDRNQENELINRHTKQENANINCNKYKCTEDTSKHTQNNENDHIDDTNESAQEINQSTNNIIKEESAVCENEKNIDFCPSKFIEYPTKASAENLSICNKICMSFDFALLKDYTYVNLNLGLTLANLTEMNFSLLTPIILTEFGFTQLEIANYMSLLAATDIIVRFIASVIADRIGWSNKTFYLVGVLLMALGRIILIHTQSVNVGMGVAIIIGIGKALRTIFMMLVIPSHVPLERLPAAYGLQFAVSGIVFIVCGPIVGKLRDAVGNYVITLHILNIFTYATALSWVCESMITNRRKNKKSHIEEAIAA